MKEKILKHIIIVFILFIPACSVRKPIVLSGESGISVGTHLTIGNYIFDTGATHSAVFQYVHDSSQSRISSGPVYDISRTHTRQRIYTVKELQLGDVTVKNASIIYIPLNDISPLIRKYKGIIGMDVINRANWFFDLKNETAAIFIRDSVVAFPDNAMVFTYTLTGTHPEVSLYINEIRFRNVRIDTGSYHTIDLHTKDIDEINRAYPDNYIGTDSVFSVSLFDERIRKASHTYQNVLINRSVFIDTLTIYENENRQDRRRIGFGLLKQFNYFFMDTKNRRIYLWR